MDNNIRPLTEEQMKEISIEYFTNHKSLEEIEKSTNRFKNELISALFLIDKTHAFSIDELSSFYLTDNKFIIISDTQIGNSNMKFDYIEAVYELAPSLNINHIFHLGDLMQGTIMMVDKKYNNEEKQIDFIINNYPQKTQIQTHILFGNHDYKSLIKNKCFLEMLKSRSDFDILGFKRCYIKWQNELLSLNHSISKYPLSLPNVTNTLFNFYGHRHATKVKNNCIYSPTLSNDLKYYDNKVTNPGFLFIEEDNNEFVVNQYIISEKNEVHCVNQGPILRKSKGEKICQ